MKLLHDIQVNSNLFTPEQEYWLSVVAIRNSHHQIYYSVFNEGFAILSKYQGIFSIHTYRAFEQFVEWYQAHGRDEDIEVKFKPEMVRMV